MPFSESSERIAGNPPKYTREPLPGPLLVFPMGSLFVLLVVTQNRSLPRSAHDSPPQGKLPRGFLQHELDRIPYLANLLTSSFSIDRKPCGNKAIGGESTPCVWTYLFVVDVESGEFMKLDETIARPLTKALH